MTVRVKICGVTSVADARAAVDLGADFLGVNFHPRSPRYVTVDLARTIVAAVPGTPVVGVFVDRPRREIAACAAAVGLAWIQLHGDEPPDAARGWDRPVVKALRAAPGVDVAALAATYDTDYILVDGYVPGQPGGTGVAVDPAALRGLDPARLFLAGGLRPETVGAAVRAVRPFAVDVASGVESAPGKKDHGKLEAFIRSAKTA